MVTEERKKELEKKIKQIDKGVDVRPPREWWTGMMIAINRDRRYKHYSRTRQRRICAGIWHDYSPKIKKDIIKRIIKGRDGVP